ncbi:MAG: hypothetical protein ACI8Y7_000823 [Candidatus Woesearchaeota archaeon]|jgi:hypothetical protein
MSSPDYEEPSSNGPDVFEKLSKLADGIGTVVDYPISFGSGFIAEQVMSTANALPNYLFLRHASSKHPEYCESDFDIKHEDRMDKLWDAGSIAGACLDTALLVGSVAYMASNDSKLAAISIGVVGLKVVSQILSFGVYRHLRKQDPNDDYQ